MLDRAALRKLSPVWLVPQFATPNLRQTVAARESSVKKIEATFATKFGMKMSLGHVR